ncbi:uncharacterized protein TRIADDRAFT_31695 [Trichoplax adhaerens]|uniref:Dopey N-terminal domain-containing protein n=1 Tax=Trichoplax adhaerens TaxID=10228 RepID=B3S9J9_TRIAD|nr:hypothetical protein TRIADDRAFT_31695 [Trichoplax adhaerens]EDV20548.1 hypothetical protein TRIADDRAFT_31695 [Trichoplax adhaerens]|eukprot:XP_002116974.1 hypothetical protein TRIADDRAFT_31695 [Trichoplax adhaerens]
MDTARRGTPVRRINSVVASLPETPIRAYSSTNNLPALQPLNEIRPEGLSRRHSFVVGTQNQNSNKRSESINLHFHRLLYMNLYDCERVLFMLRKIISIIKLRPRLFICTMATTAVGSGHTPQWELVQQLLWKHRQSLVGKGFGNLTTTAIPANVASATGRMQYLEVLVSITLYYIRSYFPKHLSEESQESMQANERVRMTAMELLSLVVSELGQVIESTGGSGFINYLKDMLNRCRMQKAVLCCLLASMEVESSNNNIYCSSEDNLAFQSQLLSLLHHLITLESRFANTTQPKTCTISFKMIHAILIGNKEEICSLTSPRYLHYIHGSGISAQPMFLASLLLALQSQSFLTLHCQWIQLITGCLPNLGSALGTVASATVNQICDTLEALFDCGDDEVMIPLHAVTGLPPDYCIILLEGLTTICHYCLLDSVYSHSNSLLSMLPWGMIIPTREGMAVVISRVMITFALISNQLDDDAIPADGGDISRKLLRQYVSQLTTPIAMNHCFVLISAIGYAWHMLSKPLIIDESNVLEQILPEASKEQLVLIDVIISIKALSIETVIENVKSIVKSVLSNKKQLASSGTSLEVDILSFFYHLSQRLPIASIQGCWQSVCNTIKECVQLSISNHGQFILLAILYTHVQKVPVVDDRKVLQERQDILQKLIQACSIIVGSALQQSTWLRRNLVVMAPSTSSTSGSRLSRSSESESSSKFSNPNEVTVQQNVQALTILAELLAPLIDIIFSSLEKDRVSSILSSLMNNVTPYLKNHCAYNASSYTASVKLLATLTNYQYTRRAWQKDVYDLFLDPNFFRMGSSSISGWRTIIDNLMANDNTAFRDMLNRINLSSTASLNLFTSRDQESEGCAQNLKRLSYVLFSGEIDQYQGFLPDIQERLADGLRLPLTPVVHEQIFFCFRILLMRMSPHHLTSLWPTIITELVQVLQIIEKALTIRDPASVKYHVHSICVFLLTLRLPNGIMLNDSAWLPLYLSACKLLDLALALPSDKLPQFQTYRWAFVTEEDYLTLARENSGKVSSFPLFTPCLEVMAGLLDEVSFYITAFIASSRFE